MTRLRQPVRHSPEGVGGGSGGRAAGLLYRYQQKWLLDPARFKIGMFARQTGKTFTTTLEIADDCFAKMVEGRAQRWVILSRGERQAKEAMDEGVKRHCKAYEVGFEAYESDVEFNGASYKQFEVTLPQGSRITALPANPDTARGFSASVFLDEFAFHKDSHAIWKALFPVISAGHRLRITSTPNGKGNKFYELMTGKDEIWSRHTVDIHQAIADGLPRNAEELRIALADEDAWNQEFLLQWLDEATAWLPYELISACEDENAGRPELYQGGWCFLGNDIAAGGGDLWVLPVFEEVGDVLWCRELIELRRASFAEQDAVMADVFARYRVARLCMDQTGMGEKPVEDAKRLYGSSRVEGIHFTGPAKLAIATEGKQRFEDRKIRIPMGDMKLRADLHSLVKVVGPTGIVRFLAPRQNGSHADRTWGIFLAACAAGTGRIPVEHLASGERRASAGAYQDEFGGGGEDDDRLRREIDFSGYA